MLTHSWMEEPPSFKRMKLGPSTNSFVASMKANTTASQNAQNQAAEAAKIGTAETATIGAAETANSHTLGWGSDPLDTDACDRQAEEDVISLFGGAEFDQTDPVDVENEALLLSIDNALSISIVHYLNRYFVQSVSG